MAHDVFISYSSHDKLVADAACAALESRRVRCWIAPRDVLPSARWGESIVTAIRECRLMVLVLSGNANASETVKDEVYLAASRGIPILPLRIEDVQPAPAFELFIMGRHWLDAMTPPLERHLERLAESVISQLGATQPPQVETDIGDDNLDTQTPEPEVIEPVILEPSDLQGGLVPQPLIEAAQEDADNESTGSLESVIAERLDAATLLPPEDEVAADNGASSGASAEAGGATGVTLEGVFASKVEDDQPAEEAAVPAEEESSLTPVVAGDEVPAGGETPSEAETGSVADKGGSDDGDKPPMLAPPWKQPRLVGTAAAATLVAAAALFLLLKGGDDSTPYVPYVPPATSFAVTSPAIARSPVVTVLPTSAPIFRAGTPSSSDNPFVATTPIPTAAPARIPTTTPATTRVDDLVTITNWNGTDSPVWAGVFQTGPSAATAKTITAAYTLTGDAQVVVSWKTPTGTVSSVPVAGKANAYQARNLAPQAATGKFAVGDYEVTIKVIESGQSKTVKFTVTQ